MASVTRLPEVTSHQHAARGKSKDGSIEYKGDDDGDFICCTRTKPVAE